ASQNPAYNSFFFLADYHALIKCHDPDRVARSSLEVAATWLALGLDTDATTFYRQSDIPEIPELTWILTCMTSKGLMNRAHAYKAAVDANTAAGSQDIDDGVTMGLFSYPVLMAADILMFNADLIPVGKDQIQHIEMARDVAGRFNHTYQPLFNMPEAVVDEQTQLIPGLDGRKMSKSYDNTIPLFCSSNELRKLINQIKTDSLEPGEPKDPDNSTLFQLFSCFADKAEQAAMRESYANGIAWGQAKTELFEFIDSKLCKQRDLYNELIANPGDVEAVLNKGAQKAREASVPLLEKVRVAAGIRPLNYVATNTKTEKKQKEVSQEAMARAEEGRRRAILMQLKPLLAQVEQADDKAAAAAQVIADKAKQVESLKKKAKQKAQNELDVLTQELSSLL
ncbi:MAG: tryptophan--tRNA ligase, partial [Pontibacterium sp.]